MPRQPEPPCKGSQPARGSSVQQRAPAGPAADGPCAVVTLRVTIDGGSEVRPITTISGSDCTLAGRRPGGRKKLDARRTSSEIVDQRVVAQSRAVVSQALVP